MKIETPGEAPFVYRGIDEIAAAVKDTVEITKILRHSFDYKAG